MYSHAIGGMRFCARGEHSRRLPREGKFRELVREGDCRRVILGGFISALARIRITHPDATPYALKMSGVCPRCSNWFVRGTALLTPPVSGRKLGDYPLTADSLPQALA